MLIMQHNTLVSTVKVRANLLDLLVPWHQQHRKHVNPLEIIRHAEIAHRFLRREVIQRLEDNTYRQRTESISASTCFFDGDVFQRF